ncbi:MAG TPA: phosphopantetheine-binding protein [Nitrospira sp.]|nr:phosphopantetheine-binding protein [Nitrospira sp.]
MSTAEEIYEKVVRVLAESLYVEEGNLLPAATLQGDLGAESLDFLEIVFRLEHEFEIDIPEDELFPRSVFQSNPTFTHNGRITDQGMNELRSRMPYADLRAFDQDRRLSAVPDLFTVGLVVRYVAWKLGKDAGAVTIGADSFQQHKALAHPE